MPYEKGVWNRLVNSKWPKDMPAPSPEEAIRGARRLYRKAMGRPWRGKVRIITGNRLTWVEGGTLIVNPNYRGYGGWRQIVHMISHYCHRRLHPRDKPHSTRQLYLERDLTDYAIANGFHLGKLKPKPKPKVDVVEQRYQRILDRQARWESKLRRAQNGLKKARTERRQYERRHGERLA